MLAAWALAYALGSFSSPAAPSLSPDVPSTGASSDRPSVIAVDVQATRWGNEVLTTAQLVQALKIRVHRVPVEALAKVRPGTARWLVEVTAKSQESGHTSEIDIRVMSPEGELVIASRLNPRGRHSADLTHTVALLVTEALAPLVFETDLPSPEPPPPEPPPPPPSIPAQPPATTLSPALPLPPAAHWAAGLTAGALQAWPGGVSTFELGPTVQWLRRFWILQGDLRWDFPTNQTGFDYRLVSTSGTARLAAGGKLEAGFLTLLASLGPSARLVSETIHGTGTLPGTHTYFSPGIGGEVSAGTDIGPLQVALVCEIAWFASHPRFLVDGSQILDTGSTTGGLALRLNWDW